MHAQSGDLRQRAAGIVDLRGEGHVTQRRQRTARRKRRQRRKVRHAGRNLERVAAALRRILQAAGHRQFRAGRRHRQLHWPRPTRPRRLQTGQRSDIGRQAEWRTVVAGLARDMQVGIRRRRRGLQTLHREHRAGRDAGIAQRHRAVLDPQVRHRNAGMCLLTCTARSGWRRSARFRRELPVRLPLRVGLQQDVRFYQHQPVDLDAVAQQRDQRQLQVQPLQRRHLRPRETRWIGEADVLHRQRRLQRQRQVDIALQRQVAAGRLLHRRDDARLQAVGIEAGQQHAGTDHQDPDYGRERPQPDAHRPRNSSSFQPRCHPACIPP